MTLHYTNENSFIILQGTVGHCKTTQHEVVYQQVNLYVAARSAPGDARAWIATGH